MGVKEWKFLIKDLEMKKTVSIVLLILVLSPLGFAQATKAEYSFGGKSGNSTMTWEEFLSCKKELKVLNKDLMIGSFLVTVSKLQKKDSTQIEHPCKNNLFSKAATESIKELHDDKKLGRTVVIDHVQIQQSGKAARVASPMIITIK